jgi:hypothetical protein
LKYFAIPVRSGGSTCRACLEPLEPGIDVDGIGRSTGRLERLREKADRREIDPAVWKADVTVLRIECEDGLVFAPSRLYIHVSTLADVPSCIASGTCSALAAGSW